MSSEPSAPPPPPPVASSSTSIWKRVSEASSAVSRLASASSSELQRYGAMVKQEGNKLSSNIESATKCQVCDKYISTTLAVTKVKRLYSCCSCARKCCSACLEYSSEDIPAHMWHPDLERSSDGRGYYCIQRCKEPLVHFWLDRTSSMVRQDFLDRLELYLKFSKTEKVPKPTGAKDGHLRKGQRILTLASYVANVVGYKQYVTAVKYMLQGHWMLNLLLESSYLKLMYPLLELLREFGIRGPEGLMRVWYFAWHCELQRKLDHNFEENYSQNLLPSEKKSKDQKDCLGTPCPQHLLDYCGSYMGPTMWLYSIRNLPVPHDAEEWKLWYLSRLVSAQGWTLLAASVDATEMYDVTCPAFALVAREKRDSADTVHKEAILVVRGSASPIDWRINTNDEIKPFQYWKGSGKKGDGPLESVEGVVHDGLASGASTMLEMFGMKTCLLELIAVGYDVKIVGHSMGASTACLLAAYLKNEFAVAFNDQEEGRMTSSTVKLLPSGDIPRVTAIGFGCMPCVDAPLADALLEDSLFISVVHRDDIVPRMSRLSLERLAKQVNDYSAEASRLRKEDMSNLKKYAMTYGLANDMGEKSLSNIDKDVVSDIDVMEVEDPLEEHEMDCQEVGSEVVQHKEGEEVLMGLKANQLVLPGQVIHLTFSQGAYKATLCDHRRPSFADIIPIPSSMTQHYMHQHVVAMRSLKLSAVMTRVSPPPWDPIYDDKTRVWSRCYVCESDPTWPYITNSDPTRGMAYHNCRSCGRVVCCVCSPAGDVIPADGIGKTQTLPDRRIPLPFLGLADEQRVCTPCFIHSYAIVSHAGEKRNSKL